MPEPNNQFGRAAGFSHPTLERLETRNLLSLTLAPSIKTGPAAFTLSADFNHDGKPDLAVLHNAERSAANGGSQDRSVNIVLGSGDGTFRLAGKYPMTEIPDRPGKYFSASRAAVGDFDNDGNVDLAVLGVRRIAHASWERRRDVPAPRPPS